MQETGGSLLALWSMTTSKSQDQKVHRPEQYTSKLSTDCFNRLYYSRKYTPLTLRDTGPQNLYC